MKLLGKLNPFRHLDRWTQAKIEREKVLVTEGEAATRGLLWRGLLRAAIGFSALFGAQWLPETWDALAWGVLGGWIGSTFLISLQRASAYRSGWLDGRQRVVEAITKTESVEDLVGVISHMAEYDTVHVLGLPYLGIIPDSTEGLEE